MAGAEDLALDTEIAAQPDTQAVGQHHQPRRDRFAVGQRELLPLRAGRDIGDLGVDEFGGGGDFGADRADQRVVHDAVLAARLLVEQIAESRDPVFAVMGRRAQHRIGDSGLVKTIELLVAADFFDAEVERIDLVRIDQNGRNSARPSMAAAVEPARPPPMIAMSVYLMGNLSRGATLLHPEWQIKA